MLIQSDNHGDDSYINLGTSAFLAVSSDFSKKRKKNMEKKNVGYIVVKLCWGVFVSCLYPLVANGDTGEKPLFRAQTLALESKTPHG